MKFFVYILISEVDQSFYIGQIQNIEKRLKQHNKDQNRSTSAKKPWKILHYRECETRAEAMKIEKYLKSLKKRSSIYNWIVKDNRGVAQSG